MTAPATPKSKPATPTDKQKPAKSPLILGKGPGPIDNAKIKAKIEKWQAAGGGAITVVEPPSTPGSEKEGTTTPAKDADKAGESEEKAEAAGDGQAVAEAANEKEAVKSPPPKSPSPIKKQTPKLKANDLDQELQAAVTPKKRVVSDGHWRKSRSPPKDSKPTGWVRPAVKKPPSVPKPEEKEEPKKSPPKIPILPKPVFAPDGTRVAAVRRRRKSTVSKSSEEDEPPKLAPEPIRRPQREDRFMSKEKPYEPPSSGNRVKDAIRRHEALARGEILEDAPAKKRSVRKTKSHYGDGDRRRDGSPSESPARGARSEDELRRRRKMRRRPTDSRDDVTSLPPDDDRPAERRRSRRKSHRTLSPEPGEKPVVTQSAPVTPQPATPTTAENPDTSTEKVFGSRVEAWLSSTPDPFVEGKDGKDKERRRSSRRSSSSTEGSTLLSEDKRVEKDAGKPQEPPSPRHGSSKRRKHRRRSYDSQDESVLSDDRHRRRSSITASHDEENLITVEYDESSTIVSTSTASSLKRRPARRASESPTKGRPSPVPATIPEDEAVSSVASSSVDASKADFPDMTPRPRNSTRREFPTVGRKLSTIASVETFDSKRKPSRTVSQGSDNTITPEDAIKDDPPGDDSGKPADAMSIMTGMTGMTARSRNSTRRRLASHADLISVLSMPERTNSKSKSLVSARSIRTNKSRLDTATIEDLMSELQSDESKYMRELRTLVDGVIPVLLTCVLSKSESAVTAGLFSKTGAPGESTKITKPIVEMGVALERLKTLHKRIPKSDPEALLSWAQSAQRVYSDYVKSWRLGFQDVVVNLAPASDEDKPDKKEDQADAESTIDEGMPRNEEGYVVNGDGERVDVAFLLKRPLVRLKYLSKTFKGINILKPSDRANDMAARYQELVTQARKRSNEERARLEDEAAASIDPTRARDPRSLAPLAGVSIDATRCVRARDYFDMTLLHSSGQEVDCRVELLIRDDAPGRGNSGDLLLCEVDSTGRWLFFPPIQLSRVSARNGDLKGEIVVMIRGLTSGGQEWRELVTLRTNDEEVGFEWVQMLGLVPVPDKVSRGLSFREKPAPRPTSSHASSSLLSAGTGSTPPIKSRTPSPREIEIPMGERAGDSSRKWGRETPEQPRPMSPETPASSVLSSEVGTLGSALSSDVLSSDITDHDELTPRKTRPPPLQPSSTTWTDAMAKADSPTTPTLKRSKAKRYSRGDPRPPRGSRDSSLDQEQVTPERQTSRPALTSEPSYATNSSSLTYSSYTSSSTERGGTGGYSVWYPPSEPEDLSDYSDEEDTPLPRRTLTKRPPTQRRTSSVPSIDLPTIPRLRKFSQPETSTRAEVRDNEMRSESLPIHTPSSRPAKLQKRPPVMDEEPLPEMEDVPPPPPPHRTPSPVNNTPPLKITPPANFSPPAPGFRQHRRTSSPLKHEYQPSTCTESSGDDSELSFSDDVGSAYSESSEDDLEADDVAPLGPLPPMDPGRQFPRPSPPQSSYEPGTATLSPSQSASQAPYRTVPQSFTKPNKTIANIFAWSENGMWDVLHPDECSIVITPGLIEAFEMGPEHSNNFAPEEEQNKRPLIAFELTPLVPLRRGTALDISIRSPPTPNSRIRTSANIMFRSRSPEECEALYNLINKARINNPTYIALQNARGPHGEDTWAAAMDRRNAERTEGSTTGGSSWWGSLGRRNSYRAKTSRAISTSAGTTSSVNTIGSAFSALKRFSGTGKLFSSARGSMYSSNPDSRSRSTDSLNGEVETSSGTSPRLPTTDDPTHDAQGMPLGIMNTKIRLYARESQQKWRDMGAARLSIMRPSRPSSPGANPYVRQGQGSPGQRNPEAEKRIVVLGKTRGETLLDVTLGESCFERVARTGIAVSVWEDTVGTNEEVGGIPAIGGVAGTKARVYMIQMKSERECAYCFSLLGKLRY
ncbi:hypothetical protein MPH_10601 [Macrophomina phaseolina MS6]|uniref:SRm160/300 splicing coactivator n=1 Tax=Macrophomina phaseolina (strain MS6) TaxID=1126212 RepID=K2QQV1_MACPH|nr:hypothetical protein MPH_10601 [Macrophomina phaseolina MS6]